MLYMYRLVRYMYISFDVYDCGKCTNTAALEKDVKANRMFTGLGVFFATGRLLFCDAHFCALPTHYLRTTSALFAHFLHFIECSRMQAAS